MPSGQCSKKIALTLWVVAKQSTGNAKIVGIQKKIECRGTIEKNSFLLLFFY